MKLFGLLAVLSLATTAIADITQYISDIPQCGLSCIVASVEQSTCSLDNSACICTDQTLAAATTLCLTQNCTVIESLQVANISNLSCGREVESHQNYLISTSGLGLVALLCVLLRLYSRAKLERALKIDDWIMAFVGVCMCVFCVLGVMAAVYGFGKNIWDVGTENLIKALRVFYINEVIYIAILGLCKASILMFYLRIFPSQNFKKVCYTILGWVAVCTILLDLLTIFQCIPIKYTWLGWTGTEKPAKCTDINAQTYASSSINIAQDFVILFLPLPWLLRLNVGWKKKLNVLFMFSLGIFICITSIIRLTKIVKFRATTNPTWDYLEPTYWSAIETYVSVIVPCLPAIRTLLAHNFPKVFNTPSENRSNGSYEQSKPHLNSFKMGASSKTTNATSDQDAESADFFPNSKLKLGDKQKGDVYTGVTSGRRHGSDIELVGQRGEVIYVKTELTVEGRAPSANSWSEDGDALSKPHSGERKIPADSVV